MALYAFDGTGCTDQKNAYTDSNVVKFRDAIKMQPFYFSGIGTGQNFAVNAFDAKWGRGGKSIIQKALANVNKAADADAAGDDEVARDAARDFAKVFAEDANKYAQDEGDYEIDIVGYSRGAALALHFANELANCNRNVRFLGLWDTVASFGIPKHASNEGWNIALPQNVAHCYHAMAIHERRGSFVLSRNERAVEVWFRGVHRDIGGAGNLELSSITLCWMLRMAEKAGVPVRMEDIKQHHLLHNAQGSISENLDLYKDPIRDINKDDIIHDSVPDDDFQAILSRTALPPGDLKRFSDPDCTPLKRAGSSQPSS